MKFNQVIEPVHISASEIGIRHLVTEEVHPLSIVSGSWRVSLDRQSGNSFTRQDSTNTSHWIKPMFGASVLKCTNGEYALLTLATGERKLYSD